MSLQSEAVKRKVKHVGAVRCDICEGMRADCVQFRTGWFSSVTLFATPALRLSCANSTLIKKGDAK